MAEDRQIKDNNESNQTPDEPRECVDTPAKKKAAVVVGCLIVVVLVAAIIFVLMPRDAEKGSDSSMADAAQAIENEQPTAEQQAAAEKGTLGMRISAEGYDAETASPAIAHISGTSDAGEAVDFCTALTLNTSTRVQIDPGAYEVEIIAPINADGSMFEAPEPFKAVVKASGIAEVAKKLTFVPAADAADAASSAANKVAQAMDMNDGTIAENAAEVAAKNAAVAS